jgi:hypothetical protein
MNLYLVHCGFYDPELGDGVYESHVNLFVAAEGFEDAKRRARLDSTFQSKKMHVDGLQEVQVVQGHDVQLIARGNGDESTIVRGNRHRDL